MNLYLVIVIGILLAHYFLETIVDFLNIKSARGDLPGEFLGFYDNEKYNKSQQYLKENTKFSMVRNSIITILTIGFIFFGGFNLADKFARGFGFKELFTGLIFAGIIFVLLKLFDLPFSFYKTFVIEEKYGFNKTSLKTFVLDNLKEFFLTVLIGGVVFAIVIIFFQRAQGFAWLYCWAAVSLIQLFFTFVGPVLILPLFNKFTPLEESELKTEIENFAKKQNFKLQGIFKIDASKRSTKSNAYFTGFGKYKRIALFDTLISAHTVSELVSILAHEIGHYKMKHILKSIIFSILATGFMFFLMNFFINNRPLFQAFKMDNLSIYASLFFFAFLYTPINLVFMVLNGVFSRKHEYQADNFAVSSYKKPEDFVLALKKLTVANLSNLTPHPIKVFLYYSHPPVLKRIEAIKALIK